MAKFFQALRFVAGLAMLAGGIAVVVPIASDILSLRDRAASTGPGAPADGMSFHQGPGAAPSSHAIPDPMAAGAAAPASLGFASAAPAEMTAHAPPQGAADPRPYQPPPPPPRLPAGFAGVAAERTQLDATYRSTLAVPPPPLLDVHGPPPVAPGWSMHESARMPVPAVAPQPSIPATYTVRDGDDLTTLAIRFYGHPGAAAALVAANRDRFTDPAILPIGARLRLPPPWTVSSSGAVGGPKTIEPGAGFDPAVETGRSPFSPAAVSHSWMSPDARSRLP